MAVTTQSSGAETLPTQFFAIALSNLRTDTIVGFDMYLPAESDSEPVLYRHRDLEFSDEVRTRLLESRVERLWVRKDQQSDYHRYMESNVRAALGDRKLSHEVKMNILYSASSDMMREFLAEPLTEDMIPRTQNMVEIAIDHMLAEKRSFAAFLKSAPLDYRTYTHSFNVAMYTLNLAMQLGTTDERELQRIGIGTFLHDIGKCHIPDRILNKPGKLTETEWRIVKKHPVWGCQILAVHGFHDSLVHSITRDHHEKLDGTGYPFGIGADQLPDVVRMTTICDVFDALSTTRSYKDAMPSFRSLEIMKSEMMGQIDARIFASFIQMLKVSSN